MLAGLPSMFSLYLGQLGKKVITQTKFLATYQ